MWSSVDSASLYYSEERKREYKIKNIKDWDSDDCLEWAADVEHELNIPLTSWISIDGFQRVMGRDLLQYSEKDFRRLIDDTYGLKFFKAFRILLRQRRDERASTKLNMSGQPRSCMDSLQVPDSGQWTVPQPLHSPVQNDCSYYGGTSPSFSYSEEDNWSNRNIETPTSPSPSYFSLQTNRDMLCGGSFTYGDPANSRQVANVMSDYEYLQSQEPADANISLDNCSFESAEGASTLLPDFNSLLIQDSYKDQFEIENIHLNFKAEDLETLDQYLHNEVDTHDSHSFDDIPDLGNEPNQCAVANLSSGPGFQDKMLRKITTGKRGNRVRHPQSWEFLVRLLMDPASNPSLVRWEDKEKGIFRLVQKEEIARLWGSRSQKHKDEPLTYDNFARILRYHYKSKVLLPVSDKHLVYQLGDKVLNSLKTHGVL